MFEIWCFKYFLILVLLNCYFVKELFILIGNFICFFMFFIVEIFDGKKIVVL